MKAAIVGALLLAGCAPTPPAAPTPAPGTAACNAEAAQALVGQPATAALTAEAMRITGARAVRSIRPGMAVTMDYREDRLNIELDAQDRVASIRCG